MAKVVYTLQADRDLDDIWDYVAQDSVLQADKLWDRFQAKLEHLARWNTIGRPRPELAPGLPQLPLRRLLLLLSPHKIRH